MKIHSVILSRPFDIVYYKAICITLNFQSVSIETLLDVFLLLFRECEGNIKNDKNMEIFVQNSEF